MWPFTSKPKPTLPPRRIITGPTCAALVRGALMGKLLPNFAYYPYKVRMACPDKMTFAAAVRKAWNPWREDIWECEDQARAVVHAAQLAAANEGCSWACGILRGDPPPNVDGKGNLHMYVWVILAEGINLSFALYDPGTNGWAELKFLTRVDLATT